MARTSRGGGARTRRASSPRAGSQKQSLPSMEELSSMIGQRPVAAALGEYGTIKNITEQFYRPTSYRNMAGQALGVMGGAGKYADFPETVPSEEDTFYYIDSRGNYVDASIFRQSYDLDEDTGELIVPGIQGPQDEESESPAPITVVPTSTTNVNRPRTVAAGYDAKRSVLTVVFRDGTWYNYYEVSDAEWKAFKSTVSKGKYIYRVLDYKPRGEVKEYDKTPGVRKHMYTMARVAQVGIGLNKGTKGTGKINK